MIEYVNPKFYEVKVWSYRGNDVRICPSCKGEHFNHIVGSKDFTSQINVDPNFNVIYALIYHVASDYKHDFCSINCVNEWANTYPEKVVMALIEFGFERENSLL